MAADTTRIAGAVQPPDGRSPAAKDIRRRSPILWVLAGGLLLRVAAMALYTPTIFTYYGGDSTRYMRLGVSGVTGLFDDTAMPAGYPAFLGVLRTAWAWLPLTVSLQHLLGLAAAALLYAAVIRAGAPRWAALLPAIVVALSGDQLFLEHGIFTEALWIPLLVAGLYCLCRALSAPEPRLRWLAAGGAVLALSATTRNVSEALPVVLAGWAALSFGGSWRVRLRHAAAVLVPAIVVIGSYVLVAKPIAGGYSGMTENSGFSLYSRVGQFADCHDFTPPKGSRALCVSMPPDQRPGPFYWTYGAASPLNAKLHFSPFDRHQQAVLRSFARTAILHQPVDYARAVAKDVVRYVDPDVGSPRPDSGTDASQMSFQSVTPTAQGASPQQLADQFDVKYSGVSDGRPSATGRYLLGAYQAVFRIQGLLIVLLLGLAVTGVALARGRARRGAILFLVTAIYLFVLPPAVSSYDVRYAVPAIDVLAAGAAFGAAAIIARANTPGGSTQTPTRSVSAA